MKNLSMSADYLLTALAVAAPDRLTSDELSDNAAMYDENFQNGIGELTRLGLARQSSDATYELTGAGTAYVDQHYEIIRNGDSVIVKKREDPPR